MNPASTKGEIWEKDTENTFNMAVTHILFLFFFMYLCIFSIVVIVVVCIFLADAELAS